MIKTVSLETAKALKDAGFRQDSYFWWAQLKRGEVVLWDEETMEIAKHSRHEGILCAAPTTDELLEELPIYIKNSSCLTIERVEDRFLVSYSHKYDGNYLAIKEGKTLPEAVAQMWLWLKKEGLLNG